MISFIYIYTHTHTAHKTCKCFLFKQENSKHNQPYQQGEKKKKGDFFFFPPNEIAREKQVCKILVLENKVNYNRPLKGEILFS